MATVGSGKLAGLYLADETAWLEAMAGSIRSGRLDELDCPNLAEYLTDMANRDRRAVTRRMTVLIVHLLKWQFQPGRRSRGRQKTVLVRRDGLLDRTESGVLRAHAAEVLAKAYGRAVKEVAIETGLPESTFPAGCPFSLEDVLNKPLESGTA